MKHISGNSQESTCTIDFSQHITVVEFSPFEWSQNLICVALPDVISIGVVKFQEEDDDQDEQVDFQLLSNFEHKYPISAITWSPETSLNVLPKILKFSFADAKFGISIIHSDLKTNHVAQELEGHTGYINSLAYDPEGKVLASGSDDHTCRLWEDEACIATLWLSSPVMSVCWHTDEPEKLLVGEQCGIVRLFNATTRRAILSMSTYETPLMGVHWAPSNPTTVMGIASGFLTLWDLSRPSKSEETRALYGKGACLVRVSPSNHHIVATLGEPNHELKIMDTFSNTPVLVKSCKAFGGMTWHYRLPFICVSIDRQLCFWKITTK